MSMNSMIPVPALLDKYNTRARPVSAWVPTTQVTRGFRYPWVLMGNMNF